MSKKKSSPTKNMKNKGGNNKKSRKKAVVAPSYKKRWIIIGAALALAIALTVTLILVFCSDEDVDFDVAESNLKKAGYSMGNYVPELNGYNGVVKTLAATYEKGSFDTLADYVNAEKEAVNLVKFNNEENAEIAYEIFCAKWSDKYDEYGLIGTTVYFGTSDACDIALTTLEENN